MSGDSIRGVEHIYLLGVKRIEGSTYCRSFQPSDLTHSKTSMDGR